MSGSAGVFKVLVAIHATDFASRHIMHFSNMAQKAGQSVGAINKQLQLMGGIAAVMAGGALLVFLGDISHTSRAAAMEVEKLKYQLRQLGGITEKDIPQIMRVESNISQTNPAIRQTEGLNLFIDLHKGLLSKEHALEAMPYAAQYLQGMKGMHGHKADGMMLDAIRASEMAMSTNFSVQAMKKWMDVFIKMDSASSGTISPDKVLGFMSQAKLLRTTITPEGLMNMQQPILENKSGLKTGTMFNALARFVVAHQTSTSVSKETMERWNAVGLLEKVTRNKKGKISGFHVKDQELFAQNPVAWIQSTFVNALASHGIETRGSIGVSNIARFATNQNAATALYTTVQQKRQILKDAELVRTSAGVDKRAADYKNSPLGAQEGYAASINRLQVALGTSLIPLFTKLAVALTPIVQKMTELVSKHPRVMQFLFVFATALGAIAVAVGTAVTVCLAFGGLLAVGIPASVLAGGAAIVAAVTAISALISAVITNVGGIGTAFNIIIQKIIQNIGRMAKAVGAAVGIGSPDKGLDEINQNAKAIKAKQQTSMVKPPSGHTVAQAITVHVHEAKTPKETTHAVAMALKQAQNPISGFLHSSPLTARNAYG